MTVYGDINQRNDKQILTHSGWCGVHHQPQTSKAGHESIHLKNTHSSKQSSFPEQMNNI